MGALCDYCGEQRSMVCCRSDAACLCLSCDRNVHSANALSRRHTRALLCHRCASQPAMVRCLAENASLCQNCDWNGHTAGSSAAGHKRQPINCYSGCPSSAELSRIWSLVSDIPNVAPEPNCEHGISMMSISDSGVSNQDNAVGDNNLLDMASASLISDLGTCDKPLVGSSSGAGANLLPLATDQTAGSVDSTPDKIRSLRGLGGSQLARVMPLELLREITNDFSQKQKLGSGTFGTVYKGVLDGKEVAVKLLHSMAQKLDYEEEFMKEFENLRRLNHPNIVQLLGYCYEIKRVCVEYGGRSVLADKIYRALCFDYMHNGSLQRHLDDEVNRLDWPTCYKIIKGTCEGLKYLHEGSKTPMYHLDLKPGNILLDKNMVPKIADFGLSKLVCDNETRATSSLLGTIRYCPPEYIEHGYVSNKFDVFSLGVVMIEIIAGSEGYSKAYETPSQEFIDHVQENWRKRLQATPGCTSPIYECRQVQRCIEIALACVSADRKQRPNIEDITSWLNEIENNAEKLATTFASQNRDMTVL